jgi:hypothetical protein
VATRIAHAASGLVSEASRNVRVAAPARPTSSPPADEREGLHDGGDGR